MAGAWSTLATGLKAATWTWFGLKSYKLACKLGKSLNTATREECISKSQLSQHMFQSGRVEKFYKNTLRKARPRFRSNKEKVSKMMKEIIEECQNVAIASSFHNNNNMKSNVSESQEILVETMMETDDIEMINSLVMSNFIGCNNGGYSDCDCWIASLAASRTECDTCLASSTKENEKYDASLESSAKETEKNSVVTKVLQTLWENDCGGLGSNEKKNVYLNSTMEKAVDYNTRLETGLVQWELSPIVKNMEKTGDSQPRLEKTGDSHPVLEKTVDFQLTLVKTMPEKTVDCQPMLEKTVDCQPLLEKSVDCQPLLEKTADYHPVLEKTVDYHPMLETTVDYQPELETDVDLSPTVDPVCVDTTTAKEKPLKLAVISQPKSPCKLCVFFAKNGKCYRANCKFSHIFQGSEKAVPSKKYVATTIQHKTFNRKPEAAINKDSSMAKGFFGFGNKLKKTVTPKSHSDEHTIKRPLVTPKSHSDEHTIKRPLAAENKTEDKIVEPPPDKISKLNKPQLELKSVANLNSNVPKEVAQLLDEVALERNTGANQAESFGKTSEKSYNSENPLANTIKAKLVLGGYEREHEEDDCEEEDDHTTKGVDMDTTPEKVVELKCKETTTDITVSTTEDSLTEDDEVEVLEELFDEKEVINLEKKNEEVILVCIKGNSTFLNHTLPLINIKKEDVEDDEDHEVITLSDDEDYN